MRRASTTSTIRVTTVLDPRVGGVLHDASAGGLASDEPSGHEGGGFGGRLIDDEALGAGKELLGLAQAPGPDQRSGTGGEQGPLVPRFAGRWYRSAAGPGRQACPAARIKSPLLCSLMLPELLSDNASAYRDLPFCAVARTRAALRIPGNAGPYRGIRANMEQTWIRTGLDHCGPGHWRRSRGDRGYRRQWYRRLARRNVSPALRVGQQMPTRLVIPAGGARSVGPGRVFGILGL
jgi:hypothetical protein